MVTNDMKDALFFYGGPFSQWYHSPFTCSTLPFLPNTTFNCAEQYMMAAKAIVFDDMYTLGRIMAADHPRDQKALGRTVKGFDAIEWSEHAKSYVYTANLLKFTSTPELKKTLMNTGTKILVEASPTDCIWGIGLAIDNPFRWDSSKWRGTNWLGITLMDVRSTLNLIDSVHDYEVPDVIG